MAFYKAERKKAKLRLGISGPSGSGKTYSALLIAHGMVDDWSKVALIDTERGSGELYADLGGYSVCPIDSPFTPKKYIDAIHEAEQLGFEVIIIDSLSHAWSGDGGMLDMHSAKTSTDKNSFTAWKEITPLHNRLVDSILQSKCHVIITVRSKTEYILIENEKGKKEPKKVGMAPIFRDGIEYETTVFFDMALNHTASTSKDRTRLFDGEYFKPDVTTGKKLIQWLESGVDVPDKTPALQTNKQKLTELFLKLGRDLRSEADEITAETEKIAGAGAKVNNLTEEQFDNLLAALGF